MQIHPFARASRSALRSRDLSSKRRVARIRFNLEGLEPRTLLSITAEFGKISAAVGTPNTNVVASFTSDDSVPDTSFTASINWGDGITTSGTISPAVGGGFDVTGTHTYATAGTFDAAVQISDGVSIASAVGEANVSPAPLTITAFPVGASLGTAFTAKVAEFTDTNPDAMASDFTATINWGDGTTSTGSVSETGGVFQVLGTHTYGSVGQFTLIVSVEGEGSFATTGFGNQTNLVSNIPGLAITTDPQLVNPWGLTPTPEFWVADNGTGVSTLYNAAAVKAGLVVTIPPPTGQMPPSAPTGIVPGAGAGSGEFIVNGKPAFFIFDTEGGTIAAWSGGTTATTEVDNSQVDYGNGFIGAVYKGLAIASQGGTNNDFLYAANFRSGNVEIFNKLFQPAGTFTDPNLTQIGYAPFGIQQINGHLFVTFAKQDADKHDDVAGPGNGYVDEFSATGTLIRRFASNGPLNSPWGLAVAPAGFGQFAGDLLVGNFGDGRISAFNLTTQQFDGQLTAAGASGPIEIPGLWAIQFGGGGGNPNTLNFTQGLNDEADGVFGTIAPTAQADARATVFDAPITIQALPIQAVSGMPFSGDVATFTVTNPNAMPSGYTATIDWGDGTTTTGAITEVGSVFHVAGTHTYAFPGAFPAIVSVKGVQSFATTGFGNQSNMVSDIPGLAPTVDPSLVNPWGIAFTPTSPFWVADNGTGVSTLYNGAGTKLALTVTIPNPAGTGPSAPTGTVANTNSNEFKVNGRGAIFLFDTEDGTIAAWNGGTSAVITVDNSESGAIYKGLAIASGGRGAGDLLFATNFHSGNIDVFNSQFTPAGSFTDASLTAQGFAPFGIQNIGGNLFVTFAKQDAAKEDDVPGPGNGFIDEFAPNGTLIQRFASNGPLNSPWGLAVAPASFGKFGGDLLVGNFGNGRINAFSLTTNTWAGTLAADGASTPLTIRGLWAIAFGNGAAAGNPNTLYFTAGINRENNGLFGSISGAPQIKNAAMVANGNILTGTRSVVTPSSGLTIDGVVGTFHDTNTLATADLFTATIKWGDGSVTTGIVSGGDGTFTVSGTHTYAKPGNYVILTKLSEKPPGTASATSIATTTVPQAPPPRAAAAVVLGAVIIDDSDPSTVKKAKGGRA